MDVARSLEMRRADAVHMATIKAVSDQVDSLTCKWQIIWFVLPVSQTRCQYSFYRTTHMQRTRINVCI